MDTQVTTKIQEDVDWFMNAYEREVKWAVDLVTRWETVDEYEQEDLISEWPLTIDFLLRVLNFQARGLMSDEQQRRFAEMRQFTRDHEADIDAVLGSGEAMIDPPREWYVTL